MGNVSSNNASVTEAADLLLAIAPTARCKAERRMAVWRKLRDSFSFNRISEIDRRTNRVVVTADEMRVLREAAKAQGASHEIRDVVERLANLERELGDLRAFRAWAEGTLASVARRPRRSAVGASLSVVLGTDGEVNQDRAVALGKQGQAK